MSFCFASAEFATSTQISDTFFGGRIIYVIPIINKQGILIAKVMKNLTKLQMIVAKTSVYLGGSQKMAEKKKESFQFEHDKVKQFFLLSATQSLYPSVLDF
jgi:hypothetical protein